MEEIDSNGPQCRRRDMETDHNSLQYRRRDIEEIDYNGPQCRRRDMEIDYNGLQYRRLTTMVYSALRIAMQNTMCVHTLHKKHATPKNPQNESVTSEPHHSEVPVYLYQ